MRRTSPRAEILVALLSIAAIGVLALSVAIDSVHRERIEIVIDSERVQQELPGAFEVPLAPETPLYLDCRGDTLASGGVSDLRLYENDLAIGPPHVAHQQIREKSAGRYSHWHRRLIFSTSDGSDPRTNGRVYRATVTLRAAAWIETSALLLGALACLIGVLAWPRQGSALARWLPRFSFALTALIVLVIWNGAIWRYAPSWAAVQMDSGGYLDGSTIRTIGYPAFLSAVASIGGDLRWLAPIQVNALVLALIFLAAVSAIVVSAPATSRTNADGAMNGVAVAPDAARARWGVGALLLFLMGTSVRTFETSFTVMADGPFTALTCIIAGCLGLAAVRRSWVPVAAMSVVLALAILVRPAGIGMVPVVLLPWWWHRHDVVRGDAAHRGRGWHRPLALVLAGVLPMTVLLASASLLNVVRNGFFGLSTMGPLSLAGHVGWMISPETVPNEPELARRIQERARPLIESRPQLAWPIDYYLYTSDEYNALLWRTIVPEVSQWLEENRASGFDHAKESSRLMGELAIGPVLHRPGAYAQHVLANTFGATHWFGRGVALLPALAQAAASAEPCVAALSPSSRALFEQWLEPPALGEDWNRQLVWERIRYPIDTRPRIIQAMAVAATVLGLMLLPWSGRRNDGAGNGRSTLLGSPAARFLGALALLVWGSIVLVSLSATVIFRYIDALDPLISTAIVMAAVMLWRATAQRVRQWRRPSAQAA